MWYLKLKTSYEGTILTKLSKENKISFSGYPVNYHISGKYLLVQNVGFLDSNVDINNLKEKLKVMKNIVKFSIHKNFIISVMKMPLWLKVLYKPEIIFVRPIGYSQGFEIIEVASWNKKSLSDITKIFKKKYNTEILSFCKKTIKNISLIGLHPELTNKQQLALKLAVENGYYCFPKKITLKQLAKIMGVSFSTYQAHLQKAEAYFIPEMFSKTF